MKTSWTIFTGFFIVIFLASCTSYQPRSIVFCDFTSSVDSQFSIQKIKINAQKILKAEARERKLEFYSISKDNNSNNLYFSAPPPSAAKPSKFEEFDAAASQREAGLTTALETASSKAAMINRSEPSSCIMDAVERAIGYFNNEEGHETASLRLYILSDMLECCRLNGRDKICVEKEMLPLNNIDSVIRTFADTSLSFKSMKNLEVYIIVAASTRKEGSSSVLQRFWERVFKLYGYDKRLYFSVNLPRPVNCSALP